MTGYEMTAVIIPHPVTVTVNSRMTTNNVWHKCCRESRQSKCTLFSHHT